MKKLLLTTAAIAATVVAVFSGYKAYASKYDVAAVLLNENIEALADGEGTSVGLCYLESHSLTYDWKFFCDRATDNETIYPCPSSESYGAYAEMSKDRCVK